MQIKVGLRYVQNDEVSIKKRISKILQKEETDVLRYEIVKVDVLV